MTRKRCHFFSDHTKLVITSFAAAHPQVVPNIIELCLTLSRYTFLYDTRFKIHNYSEDWIDFEKIARASPSATTIDNWVKKLAQVQVMVSRNMLSTDNISSFFQTDGGHAGQEVSLFSLYNHERKQVEQIWSSCTTVGGKFSEVTAMGAKQRMNLFFRSANPKVDGICVDSG